MAGRIYLLDDNDEQSSLVALDARTGTDVWRVERARETNWATPFIWRHAQRTEIVVSATHGVESYDLDGKRLWTLRGMSSIVIPTPFESGGLLYVASGYVGDQVRPVYAIKPGATGDITLSTGETSNAFVAWSLPQAGPYNPSPIVYDGLYYTLLDRGFFTAHDARTGAEVYGRQRIDPAGVGFTASPWAANGRLYAISEDGDTLRDQGRAEVRAAGEELARRDDDGDAGDGAGEPHRSDGGTAVSDWWEVTPGAGARDQCVCTPKRANNDNAPYPDRRAKRRCDSGKSTPMANQ